MHVVVSYQVYKLLSVYSCYRSRLDNCSCDIYVRVFDFQPSLCFQLTGQRFCGVECFWQCTEQVMKAMYIIYSIITEMCRLLFVWNSRMENNDFLALIRRNCVRIVSLWNKLICYWSVVLCVVDNVYLVIQLLS